MRCNPLVEERRRQARLARAVTPPVAAGDGDGVEMLVMDESGTAPRARRTCGGAGESGTDEGRSESGGEIAAGGRHRTARRAIG